jgi:membrane-associated phospholipid phosphatase
VNVAIYDAIIAAWDSKYTYNRSRPNEVDATLGTLVSNPRSPSYPSDYAAAAGAASTVLSYLYPSEAKALAEAAEEAARSRLYARVEYPSDYSAGLELGRAVGARVVERARADGSNVAWAGTVPTGPGTWIPSGLPPVGANTPMWRPFVLSSAGQFRPEPPPAWDSPEKLAELAEVKNFPRNFTSNYKALLAQSPEGYMTSFYLTALQRIFEYRLHENPPRAARVHALMAVARYDTQIASYEAKFTYWAPRPSHLDPAVTVLYPIPNHPCYPSNAAAFASVQAEILRYLFPRDAHAMRAKAAEAGDTRVWAGIHFPSCVRAGRTMAARVAQKVIEWAEQDLSK